MEFLHQLLMSSHLSIFSLGLSLIIEADHLRHGAKVDVVADMAEQGARNSPENSVLALLHFLSCLFESGLSGLSVHDLMVASEDIAACDVLKH